MHYYILDGEYYSHNKMTIGKRISKAEFDIHISQLPLATDEDETRKGDYDRAILKLDFIAKHLGLI